MEIPLMPAKDRSDAQGPVIDAKCNVLSILGNSSWAGRIEDLLMLAKDRPDSYAVMMGCRCNVFAVPGKAD